MTAVITSMLPLRNRMAESASPYLKQHANNPVQWQPWENEVFTVAQKQDLPILLSIGYSACHWCHVMAHESFEDESIARSLNQQFVCIKVDREERPDVDAVYMAVTQALNDGRGGWPMTIIMTPDKKPFFAGTYFPPRAQRGMPGFADIIAHIGQLWRTDRSQLTDVAKQLTAAVTSAPSPSSNPLPDAAATQALSSAAIAQLSRRYDGQHGGFTAAPKFPHTETLRFLLQQPSAPEVVDWVCHTLDNMALGGLFDVVGGGFSRYSVDAQWHVPHFEKMLYDNALLASTYSEASMAMGRADYSVVARRTLNFVLAELLGPDQLFYAALDADSEGHEGTFYVWHEAEARNLLLAHMPAQEVHHALRALSFTQSGNWENGANIPRLAQGHNAEDPVMVRACAHLAAARAKRIRPHTDTKVLTGHNGLMLSALALGCRALSEPAYLEQGCRTANAIWAKAVGQGGQLARLPNYPAPSQVPGMLEDYAYLAEGLLALYEAGGPLTCLYRAENLCTALAEQFVHEASGAFYQTGTLHEQLLFRPIESHDGATPSAYATAAHVLLRVAVHTGNTALHTKGEAALGAMAPSLHSAPHAHCQALMALQFAHRRPQEAIFVSDREPWAEGPRASLFAAMVRCYAPHRVVGHHDGQRAGAQLPLLQHRAALHHQPTVYLCQNQTCRAPITSLTELGEALEDLRSV